MKHKNFGTKKAKLG